MSNFRRENRAHIERIFESKTGVKLTGKKSARGSAKVVLALAAAFCFLTMSAFTVRLFSSLDEDELSLQAVYEGNGVVSIVVENRSDKDLRFQEQLKLMRWSTGEEIEPEGDDSVAFSGVKIPARSTGTMTVDLSGAYDIEALEQPLSKDWYYLVLTNNNFAFGQDWMCGVNFSDSDETLEAQKEGQGEGQEDQGRVSADKEIMQEILADLRFYFEDVTFDVEERRMQMDEYMQRVTELFSRFEGNIVPSVSPRLLVGDPEPSVILDDTVPLEEQHLLIGENHHFVDWDFKLLATDKESALLVSAMLPLKGYKDAFRSMPVFYIFTYEREAIKSGSDYAFIYGRFLRFSDMEKYKVYEDDTYVCYEMSSLIYSDLQKHTERFLSGNPDVQFDDKVQKRVENIYNYYKENMGRLFYYL